MVYVRTSDAGVFADRLHFSWIDDPAEKRGSGQDRTSKDVGGFQLVNDGVSAVSIESLTIDGPFRLAGSSPVDKTIPAGGALDVAIAFDRALFEAPSGTPGAVNVASAVFGGTVAVTTKAGETLTVDLGGLWQPVTEGGYEPNLNEIWEAFGFSNHIEGLTTANNGGRDILDTSASYLAFDETEILSPYWRIADGWDSFTVTQIGSYTGPYPTQVDIHGPDALSTQKRLWRVAPDDTQRVLPDRTLGGGKEAPASLTLDADVIPDSWKGDDVFGFYIGRASSDPTLNVVGDYLRDTDGAVWRTFNGSSARNEATGEWKPIAALDLIQQGHWVRSYVAVDADGNVVPDTYLIAYDYPLGNHDYNDVVLVAQGVAPADPDAAPTPTPPTPAQTSSAPGGAPWAIDAAFGLSLAAPLFDLGGEGVAYGETTPHRVDKSDFRPEESVEYTPDGGALAYGDASEWVEYTVSVAEAGSYELSLVTATPIEARIIEVAFAKGDKTYETADVAVRVTGDYGAFAQSDAVTVDLEAGDQVMRVTFENGAANLRSLVFSGVDVAPTDPPQWAASPDGAPWLVDAATGLTVDALLFDEGGEGVAWSDASEGRQDETGHRSDTSVEFSRGLEAIGYTEAGEWVEYTVFVERSGTYDLSLITGTNQDNRVLTASFEQDGAVYESAEFAVANTRSFKTFVESDGQTVDLRAGEQVLRVAFDNGAADLSGIHFAPDDLLV